MSDVTTVLAKEASDKAVEIARLKAENAKLRELVRDMYRNFVNCDCELRLHGRTFMAEARYAHRMRELGVVE